MVVFLIVAVFLVWFAVISMQIFGYLNAEPACDRFGVDQFGNFFNVMASSASSSKPTRPTFPHVYPFLVGIGVNVSVGYARRVDGSYGRDHVSS